MADVPKPNNRKDMYYSYLINGTGELPNPIDREDHYLYYLCVNGFGGGGGGTIPTKLPNPYPITFGGMLPRQSYDGSEEVAVIFPDVEILNETAGTPVGDIISYMGVTAPANYLVCDGAEYQISDYPYLTQHFLDNFGSVNFFGGDGEATFAVPDLRGEFLRGWGQNSHNIQGSGGNVGEHQDATIIPSSLYEPGTNHVTVSGSNFLNADSTTSSGTDDKRGIVSSTVINSDNAVYKFSTRPTNTSVLYCIKYKPTYFATVGHTYSYEERRVGTWADGKPLYEKTVKANDVAPKQHKIISHECENVETIWIENVYAKLSDNTVFTIPTIGVSGECLSRSFVNRTVIIIDNFTSGTTYNCVVTLRYTKTTD